MPQQNSSAADNFPIRAPRSKLEPHRALIAELREKNYTYEQISAALKDRLNLSATASTINHFVKVRSRRKEPFQLPDPRGRSYTQPSDEIERRMSELRNAPPANEMEPQRFEYTPGETLRAPATPRKKS
jgi:hypothetical protein